MITNTDAVRVALNVCVDSLMARGQSFFEATARLQQSAMEKEQHLALTILAEMEADEILRLEATKAGRGPIIMNRSYHD